MEAMILRLSSHSSFSFELKVHFASFFFSGPWRSRIPVGGFWLLHSVFFTFSFLFFFFFG
jgi:hypothetical protein